MDVAVLTFEDKHANHDRSWTDFSNKQRGGDGGLGGGWVGEVLDIFQVTGQFGDNFF